jgi:hypothetical protein
LQACFTSWVILERVVMTASGFSATARRARHLLGTLDLERSVVSGRLLEPLHELAGRELEQLDPLEHARLQSHALLLTS